jgi:hypothetical protein
MHRESRRKAAQNVQVAHVWIIAQWHETTSASASVSTEKFIWPRGLPPLSAEGASSDQTSVHAVEGPWLPLGNLSADAVGAAELQCALKGDRPLIWPLHPM